MCGEVYLSADGEPWLGYAQFGNAERGLAMEDDLGATDREGEGIQSFATLECPIISYVRPQFPARLEKFEPVLKHAANIRHCGQTAALGRMFFGRVWSFFERGGRMPCGVPNCTFRKVLEYSAGSTRVFCGEYADDFRRAERVRLLHLSPSQGTGRAQAWRLLGGCRIRLCG